MVGFATFALAHLPNLSHHFDSSDFLQWLAAHESIDVEGAKRWLIWGDRLADEAEMKLNWARERGLVNEARLSALQGAYTGNDPDTETINVS